MACGLQDTSSITISDRGLLGPPPGRLLSSRIRKSTRAVYWECAIGYNSQIQWKSFLRFEGEAQIVGGVFELAAE